MWRKKTRRGAVLVEFALSFLVFILLSIGLFEMARMMWAYTTLSHAVRQGTRYAIVRGGNSPSSATDQDIEGVVKNHAIGLVADDITVQVTWESAAADGGEFVRVRATYPFQFVTGTAFISKGSLALGAQSEMTIAY